jgi:hypothetical protein
LFLFFALEGILGDKSEGLKAHGLAFRRAMLGIATRGQFVDPNRIFYLYDRVRSAAVHGEHPPELDWRMVGRVAWDVRRALNEYLEYARERGLQKRSRVLRALKDHPDATKLIASLCSKGGPHWQDYLDSQQD